MYIEVSELAEQFIQYLEKHHLLVPCHIRQLEEDFTAFVLSHFTVIGDEINFYEVVFQLEHCRSPFLLVNQNGNVKFQNRISERSKLFSILRNPKNKEELLKGNASINISCSSSECIASNGQFKFHMKKESSSYTLVIRNDGKHSIFLKKCLPLNDIEAITFDDVAGCTRTQSSLSLQIKPTYAYEIQVSCKIVEDLGRYDTDLFFNFEIQNPVKKTIRRLAMLTFAKSNSSVDELKPEIEYEGRKKITRYKVSKRVPGERIAITSNLLENDRKLDQYSIPQKFAQAVINKVFTKSQLNLTQQEKQWKAILHSDLASNNYSKKFSLLLHLEELQAQNAIRMFDLKSVTLAQSKSGHQFWLEVPGLAEKRPSLIKGDTVYLYELDRDGNHHHIQIEGIVHDVQLDKVLLGMSDKCHFIKGMKFDVVFTFSRFPLRIEHRAISNQLIGNQRLVTFPEPPRPLPAFPTDHLQMFNKKINDNAEQTKAIQAIVHGLSSIPYVLYGPPGTGKTVTLVEAIIQVLHRDPNSHVLVCAPSNSAVDLLAERLLDYVDKSKMFRLCAASRHYENTPKSVQGIMNYNLPNREFYFPSKLNLCKYNILLTTLISAGRLASAKFPPGHFNYVFVDEAGYATEPQFMTAVAGIMQPPCRLVLAGDPKQLGPILFSRLAGLFGLGMSYLERLFEFDVYQPDERQDYNPCFITKLVKNYRSHGAIIEIPNQCFYDNELEECADVMERTLLCNWPQLPQADFPLIFHSVKGKDVRESSSPSYFNAEEAVVVADYAIKLLEARGNGITARCIGIISPYRKQVQKIRQVLKKRSPFVDLNKLKVGSVEEFQGQERRVIIISTVRSSNSHLTEDNKFRLGFLNNPKLENEENEVGVCSPGSVLGMRASYILMKNDKAQTPLQSLKDGADAESNFKKKHKKNILGINAVDIGCSGELMVIPIIVKIKHNATTRGDHRWWDFYRFAVRCKARFNVAITRAKSLLIVVGDPDILCLDFYWNTFINYCIDNRAYVGPRVKSQLLKHTDDQSSKLDDLLERFHLLEIEGMQEAVPVSPPEE